jgi:acetyltransferase-like isoleucine patch superfamily enzyme
VNAAAVVGALSELGTFVHVNRNASIGHDALIEGYASIGPGTVLSGGVRIARGAFLGAGAVVAPGVTIGSNAIVGAGSVVVRNIEPNAVVAGNPAKVLRVGVAGYNDVGIQQ